MRPPRHASGYASTWSAPNVAKRVVAAFAAAALVVGLGIVTNQAKAAPTENFPDFDTCVAMDQSVISGIRNGFQQQKTLMNVSTPTLAGNSWLDPRSRSSRV